MPIARKHQISLNDTPFYHCISRCVRRAFLCGEDSYTGKSYEHRKQWVADRLSQLAQVFAIDVCSYAVMSNHFHGVLKINQVKAQSWAIDEIIERWTQLFSGGTLVQRYKIGQCKTEAESSKVIELAEIWRERLMDISWFMRCLNESIARQANTEDNCTGRFWEGRFKCQALLDEQALLACMTYVDLNPIRAGICNTLEESEFTSIAQRLAEFTTQSAIHQNPEIKSLNLKPKFSTEHPSLSDILLADFVAGSQTQQGIPYALEDYFELVDWTGRAIRDDKKGFIPESELKILHKLGIGTDTWLETVGNFTHQFRTFVGPKDKLATICEQQQKKWLIGIQTCRRLFSGTNPIIT